MIRRGGYRPGSECDCVSIPKLWLRRGYLSKRWIFGFAFLLTWRGRCVVHLLDSWYLPTFERVPERVGILDR